jgi:hypothetical protein
VPTCRQVAEPIIASPAIWSAAYRQAWRGLSIAKSHRPQPVSIILCIGLVRGRSRNAIAFAQPLQQVTILAGLAAERRELGARGLAAQRAGAGIGHAGYLGRDRGNRNRTAGAALKGIA